MRGTPSQIWDILGFATYLREREQQCGIILLAIYTAF